MEAKLPVDLKESSLEILSDEILLRILLRFIPDAKTLACVSAVSKRCRSLLLEDEDVIKRIFEARVAPGHRSLLSADSGTSLFEKLGFYQAVVERGLFDENRIGFDFASTIVDDDGGSDSGIQGSKTRIDALAMVLGQFDKAHCVIDAHAGTAAPAAIAPGFSRSRGEAVYFELIESSFAIANMADRIVMNP